MKIGVIRFRIGMVSSLVIIRLLRKIVLLCVLWNVCVLVGGMNCMVVNLKNFCFSRYLFIRKNVIKLIFGIRSNSRVNRLFRMIMLVNLIVWLMDWVSGSVFLG